MRRFLGLISGLLAFVMALVLDFGLEGKAKELAAICCLVVVFLVTEVLPLPATVLLASVLCTIFEIAPAREIFAPYADPVIFVFVGAFLLAEAMNATGLDRRAAQLLLAPKRLRTSAPLAMAALATGTALVSMWMSNTAAAAVMMPIAVSMFGQKKKQGLSAVLCVAYAASIGGIATPIGTPPNLVAIAYLERNVGVHLGFAKWMGFGLPLAAVLLGCLFLLNLTHIGGECGGDGRQQEPLSGTFGQKVVLVVFGLVVLGWLLPFLVRLLVGQNAADLVERRLPESAVALAGALMLFLLPASWSPYKPVLGGGSIRQIDWGTILLFGGGLSLGSLVSKTGLGEYVGRSIVEATGLSTSFGLVVTSAVAAVVLTEFVSNTAAIAMVAPVVHGMAVDLGLSPTPAIVAAALASSMAFMFPVSTPPNAIAYGTGLVKIPQMLMRGIALDILALGAITFWVCFVAAW